MTYRFNVLLIGSGGRENALARALYKSESCALLYCAPGNPGIQEFATYTPLDISNGADVVAFCNEHKIELVVVGPEIPLSQGLADILRENNMVVFGPSAAAAQIETSKVFAKELMRLNNIPTAQFRRFTKAELDQALEYVAKHTLPVVIKADGLAAGKGVIVASTHAEAELAVQDILGGQFGKSGAAIVVEDFLEGQEASLFVVTDGIDYVVLAPAQDHKRIGNNDTGKNTGGMGSYAPAPLVTKEVLDIAKATIIEPTLNALQSNHTPFIGCLFAGLMVHADNTSSVVEFNCRFGDPETQSVLTVFRGDLCALFYSAAIGKLNTEYIHTIAEGYACSVVMASKGYPDTFQTGFTVTLPRTLPEGVAIDHAGTTLVDSQLRTSGGRVLAVTAHAATLRDAQQLAYKTVEMVDYQDKYYRTDIAEKGLAAL